MMNKVYIRSAALLSASDEVDFRQYIPPMQARRMGMLLKRALVTAKMALSEAGMDVPGAIVCGTGLGCMETTERILSALRADGEQGGVSPTDFMQSTHNTIASTVALHLGCHGYNCSYSQGDVSFENALMDAFLLVAGGHVGSALVCGNDEMTEATRERLAQSGYFSPKYESAGLSVSFVLSSDPSGALCSLESLRLFHGAVPAATAPVVLEEEDYKALYGECPVSSAAGMYKAVGMFADGENGPVQVRNASAPDGAIITLAKQ